MKGRSRTYEKVPYLGSLFWPWVEAGVVDAEVAVLADDEVLVFLRLAAHQARLAVVARPAVPHEVPHQVGAVDAARRVHRVAAAEAAVWGRILNRWKSYLAMHLKCNSKYEVFYR